MLCRSWNQNRRNILSVTGLVEVLEVKGVIPDLVKSLGRKRFLANLEFKHKDDGVNQEKYINTSSHARYGEFEINHSRVPLEYSLQYGNLFKPSVPLCVLQWELIVNGQYANDFLRR